MSRYLPLVYHTTHIAMSSFKPTFLANRSLSKLSLLLSHLIALLVAGEVEVCSMLEHDDFWDITISLNKLMHLYTWQRVEGSTLCLVFCSTPAALVSVIPVLCSWILRSLRGWVIDGTPLTVCFE